MSILIDPIPKLSLKDAIERMNNGEDIGIVTHEILEERIERIARRAWDVQMSMRTSAPTTDDLTEMQGVPAEIGGVKYIYIMVDGKIVRWTIA